MAKTKNRKCPAWYTYRDITGRQGVRLYPNIYALCQFRGPWPADNAFQFICEIALASIANHTDCLSEIDLAIGHCLPGPMSGGPSITDMQAVCNAITRIIQA